MSSIETKDKNTVDPSVSELVGSVSRDISKLLSAHIELAKAELKESATSAAAAAAMFIVAGVFSFLGFVFLLVTLAYVLVQLGLPVWAGFGIVTLLLFIVAVVLALVGRSQAKKIKSPEQTVEQIEETKTALAALVP